MYVRQAYNRDEAWLLDKLDEAGLTDGQFRSRDYAITVKEDDSKCGFARIQTGMLEDDDVTIIDHLTVLEDGKQNAARVRENLYLESIEKADRDACATVYTVSSETPSEQFEFEEVENVELVEEALTLYDDGNVEADELSIWKISVDEALDKKSPEERIEELADEFGYEDPTTKYNV